MTRRLNYDAILYEGYSIDTRKVQYSRTAKELWNNISSLIETYGMMEDSMLCTRGSGCWFAFPMENSMANGMKYTLITGEVCMPAKTLRSLKPVGDMRKSMDNSMVMFPMAHFGGEQQTMMDKDTTASMDAQSIAVFGDKEYLIDGSGPSGAMKICLKPQKDMSICIMKDVDTSLGMAGAKSFKSDGPCSTMDDPTLKVVYLETCYDQGMHEIKHNEDMCPKNLKHMCSDSVDQPIKNNMALIMEIFDARVRRQIQERSAISMPSETNFKVMMLTQIFDIFGGTCQMDKEYLGVLQSVLLQRLRAVWKQNRAMIGTEDEKWKQTMTYLESCYTASTSGLGSSMISSTPCAEQEPVPRNMQEESALKEMMDGDQYDVMIDQMWIIFEMVTPYCNTVNEYDGNEWAEMTNVLKKYFMTPLRTAWKTPGMWQQLYPTMFHGFDIDEHKQRLISCAHNMLSKNSARDPVGRVSWSDGMDMMEPPVMKARKIGK